MGFRHWRARGVARLPASAPRPCTPCSAVHRLDPRVSVECVVRPIVAYGVAVTFSVSLTMDASGTGHWQAGPGHRGVECRRSPLPSQALTSRPSSITAPTCPATSAISMNCSMVTGTSGPDCEAQYRPREGAGAALACDVVAWAGGRLAARRCDVSEGQRLLCR